MTLVRDESSQIEQQDTQVLFEEARQRRRRLRLVGAAIVLVVAAAATALGVGIFDLLPAGPGSHPSGSRPSVVAHNRTGATLVYSFNNLRVINADTGASRTLPLPGPTGGASDGAMVRIGDSLLLNKGDTAWLYRSGLIGSPVDLGPSLRIIPGPAPNEVWLWLDPSAGYVRLVDFSGHQIGPPIALPVDTPPNAWFPTGEVVGTDLVLEGVEGGEAVWDPISNRVTSEVPNDASVIAAGGHLVAWMTNGPCQCTVHLTNVQTGLEQDLPLPTKAVTFPGGGAFSPDGATLAVSVGLGGAWPGRHPTALALVDLRTRAVRILPGSEQRPIPNYGAFNATWSRTGWLFYTAYGFTHVLAWHPGDQRALVLPKARISQLPPPGSGGQQLPSLIAL